MGNFTVPRSLGGGGSGLHSLGLLSWYRNQQGNNLFCPQVGAGTLLLQAAWLGSPPGAPRDSRGQFLAFLNCLCMSCIFSRQHSICWMLRNGDREGGVRPQEES